MSDTEEMEPESKIFLPASQQVGHEIEQTVQTEPSQNSKTDQTEPSQNSKTSKTAKPKKPTGAVQYPCIYCGNNAAKGVVQCTICALWCHMSCTGLSKEAIRGLEVQAKEVGLAYWACRACMNFNTKWNKQMSEVSKRQDETEARVERNSDRIDEVMR